MATNTSRDVDEGSIPQWIFWYGAIVMVAVPLVYAVMTFVGPNLGEVTLSDGEEIDTALFKYGVRNVAAAAITAVALFRRSAPMLLLVFLMRFITESGDLLDIVFFIGESTAEILSFVVIMVLFALIPYAIGIRQLWPMVRSHHSSAGDTPEESSTATV